MCSDVGLSAINVMMGHDVPLSHYKWDIKNASTPLPSDQILAALEENLFDTTNITDGQINFYINNEIAFSSTISDKVRYYSIELLLKPIFASSLYSYSEKKSFLNVLPCVSAMDTESFPSHSDGLYTVHSDVGNGAFIWVKQGQPSLKVEATLRSLVNLTLLITSIVAIAIILMLILIWKELLRLESRRKTFEILTKQIARGVVDLPENLSDSGGALEELADSFGSMSSHIERLLRVQRDMTNAISHELRTPIARLRFGLEALKDDVHEDVLSTIYGLEGDVEELNTLVDEVLTYGKLEEGALTLNFTQVDINQIILSIIESNVSLLSDFDIEVDINSEQSSVSADSHHLHRALQNLILNATKYAKSRVKVSFVCDEESWQVDIDDDGPGIAFEDRDKVFIPFQRLDNSRTRASGGYGLGLAIVQKIAFWHGGAVLIDSSHLGGAKFSFIWSKNYHKKDVS
ncbi:ATP-binding protein [Marinomonas sp. 15G1-11]|uniref:histidine kinase n=1 Tax=Marinomonas phaeophyticola TaxID=3004091 RepID=A0ABT4JQC2_9GAMM|nr:ATP-binding protein [Marinomonas sp. 15G1-11]MCZ2720578.1 ATP-binding protein [Marinomonas sp. 15G1-11]